LYACARPRATRADTLRVRVQSKRGGDADEDDGCVREVLRVSSRYSRQALLVLDLCIAAVGLCAFQAWEHQLSGIAQGAGAAVLTFDADALRDDFQAARRIVLQRALWDAPDTPTNTCRYCGKHWRRWTGSKLDGHAACVVTEDFKRHVGELLRSPTVTYSMIAETIGLTRAIVRSWTFPIRIVKFGQGAKE
jgi:hypothetical protein